MFTPIWGRFLFWLIFFRWVETTNQMAWKMNISFLGCHLFRCEGRYVSRENTSSKPLIFRGHVSFQGSTTSKPEAKKSWENYSNQFPLVGIFPPYVGGDWIRESPSFDAHKIEVLGPVAIVPETEVRKMWKRKNAGIRVVEKKYCWWFRNLAITSRGCFFRSVFLIYGFLKTSKRGVGNGISEPSTVLAVSSAWPMGFGDFMRPDITRSAVVDGNHPGFLSLPGWVICFGFWAIPLASWERRPNNPRYI